MKHSLLAASILAFGLAVPALSAENTSDVDQIGLGHLANVNQHGNAKNTSKIVQKDGDGSDALVHQNGTGGTQNINISNIEQLGSDHVAIVDQDGADNENTSDTRQLSGTGNRAETYQRGNDNKNDSTIFQYGFNETAIVTQEGDGNVNKSVLVQSGAGNFASVYQYGTNNESDSLINLEAGLGNVMWIDQGGTDNTNKSEAKTFGNSNFISVQQGGTANTNDSFVNAVGSNNVAVVAQN